ncbi:MAG: hypothetical protein WC508_03650 [Patescibacteria group bacterium]
MIISVFGGSSSGGDGPGWVPNTTYVFSPPVLADGIPAHKPRQCEVQILEFARGSYVGYIKGNHVFLGMPINDPRQVPEDKRECFFYVKPSIIGSRMEVEAPPRRPGWMKEILEKEGLE